MKDLKIDKGIKSIFELLSLINAYVDNQAPWKLKKTDTIRMYVVLFLVLNLIIKTTIMLSPIIPNSANKVLKIFNFNKDDINVDNFTKFINRKIIVNNPIPIFPRVDE